MLISGSARGPVLRLDRPISFWGGVDPTTGRITDPRHPQHGQEIAGTVLMVPATVGSSSSSAVLLELISQDRAPAAILVGHRDAILCLGAVVARAMTWQAPPIAELSFDYQRLFRTGTTAWLTDDGILQETP
ncbi:MAG: DUF126 domain-containing protein [Pseudomonadota bacterium]